MLKHEDNPTSEPLPAAKVRVTPTELADALAVMQARKEGDLDTIALGDAVHDLNLDETPEDVLRVVQARREEVQREQATSRRKTKRTRWLALTAAMFAVFPVTHLLRTHGQTHSASPAAIATPAVIAEALPEMQTVSAVPNEQEFYADAHALAQMFQKAPAEQIIVHRTQADPMWSLIKHGGKIYLEAYTPPISENQLKQKHAVLYSVPLDRYATLEGSKELFYRQAEVPLATLSLEDSQMKGPAEQITVSHIVPDSYLWEAN